MEVQCTFARRYGRCSREDLGVCGGRSRPVEVHCTWPRWLPRERFAPARSPDLAESVRAGGPGGAEERRQGCTSPYFALPGLGAVVCTKKGMMIQFGGQEGKASGSSRLEAWVRRGVGAKVRRRCAYHRSPSRAKDGLSCFCCSLGHLGDMSLCTEMSRL